MPLCEKCGNEVGSAKFCRSCGEPTLLGRRAQIDETRLVHLGSQITDNYAAHPERPAWIDGLLENNAVRLALAGLVAVAIAFGGALLARAIVARATHDNHPRPHATQRAAFARSASVVAQSTMPPATHAPTAPPPTPTPTAAPTQTPTVAPTSTPAATRLRAATARALAAAQLASRGTASPAPATSAPSPSPSSPPPTATPAAQVASGPAPPLVAFAPAIVRSAGALAVGPRGSCGPYDVSIAVSGYPSGCTAFRAASSGRLANGLGTALVVPVTVNGSLQDVAYGLLYIQQSDASGWPHFLGVLPGDGSGHLVVRVQDGVIVEQNGGHTKYSTFDGRRVVWLGG